MKSEMNSQKKIGSQRRIDVWWWGVVGNGSAPWIFIWHDYKMAQMWMNSNTVSQHAQRGWKFRMEMPHKRKSKEKENNISGKKIISTA